MEIKELLSIASTLCFMFSIFSILFLLNLLKKRIELLENIREKDKKLYTEAIIKLAKNQENMSDSSYKAFKNIGVWLDKDVIGKVAVEYINNNTKKQ